MTLSPHEAALLERLGDATFWLDAGDAEMAATFVAEAAALCGPGAPPLSKTAADAARAAFARCTAAEQKLRAELEAERAALGASTRALNAYQR